MTPLAFFVGFASCSSIVLSDVPASLFFTPARARASRAVTVSLKLRPTVLAADPACDSAMPKSETSAVVALADTDSASATCCAWDPESPKRFIAFAVVDAASAKVIWPATDSVIAACSPPPRI